MIAEKDSAMQEATKELYVVNVDELIRQQAQARADYEFYQRQKDRKMKRLQEENAELKTALKSAQEEAEKRVAALEAELKGLREKKE